MVLNAVKSLAFAQYKEVSIV